MSISLTDHTKFPRSSGRKSWTAAALSLLILCGAAASPDTKRLEQEAHSALAAGDHDLAIELWKQARMSMEEAGALPLELSGNAKWIAEAYRRKGNFDQAKYYSQQRLRLARETGIDTEISQALSTLAEIEEMLHQFDEAYELRIENVRVTERVWARGFLVSTAYSQVAKHLAQRGRHAEAASWYQLALHRIGPDRYSTYEARILDFYADSLAGLGRDEEASAVRLLANAMRALPPELSIKLRKSAHQYENQLGPSTTPALTAPQDSAPTDVSR